MATAKLFVSAVTSEFRTYREAVFRWFSSLGIEVLTQEQLMASGQTMLLKLSDSIATCDAVVHLVGDRAGGEVEGPAYEHLLEAIPDLLPKTGLERGVAARLSWTQWEAWLSIYHKKRLVVAVPEEDAPRDCRQLTTDSLAGQREAQRDHLAALATQSRYPEISFSSADNLCMNLVQLRDLLLRGARDELNLTNLVSLKQYRSGLAGFRRFLIGANLPFRAPELESDSHPQSLLQMLEMGRDDRGVLLAGAGGVGKTRTSYETALLAEGEGWRVVYALPGRPAVTAESIIEAAMAHGPGKTLVIIEYLDQMHELDLGVLRRYATEAASSQGTRFGLLANCRPGFLIGANEERDACFDTVLLAPTLEEARDLSAHVALHAAPKALHQLGEGAFLRLCGHRPILALLVAAQLERLAESGELTHETASTIRSGDLAQWLRRRLDEDQLGVPKPASPWDISRPTTQVLAAASALAAAPDSVENLNLIAATVFQGDPESVTRVAADRDARASGRKVVGVLHRMGWLEPAGPWLEVVHDVVADEVLEHILFELDDVRPDALASLMTPALERPRTLGRLGKALVRAVGGTSVARIHSLQSELGRWIAEHARQLGEGLASAEDSEESSFALGTLLGGSFLTRYTVENWGAIVTPWLLEHGDKSSAWYVLSRGLRSGDEHVAAELAPAAMAWLETWGLTQNACYVLPGLIRRPATSNGPEERTVLQLSRDWLARFGNKIAARFVLTALLSRRDLDQAALNHFRWLAVRWLDRFAIQPEAQFMYGPLLHHLQKGDPHYEQILEWALEWCVLYEHRPEATFSIAAVLSRSDLTAVQVVEVEALCERWLTRFGLRREAQHVIHALLNRESSDARGASVAIQAAFSWLDRFGETPDATFVYGPLLKWDDIQERTADLVSTATLWLRSFEDSEGASYVIAALLGRNDLTESMKAEVCDLGLKWLGRFRTELSAGFVITAIYAHVGEPLLTRSAGLAVEWLRSYGHLAGAGYVLSAMLDAPEIPEGARDEVLTIALEWSAHHLDGERASYVIRRLLDRKDTSREAAEIAIQLALKWTSSQIEEVDAHFVLHVLLASSTLVGESLDWAVELALSWLSRYPHEPKAAYVLEPLLSMRSVEGLRQTTAIEAALRWVTASVGSDDCQFVLRPLLGRLDLTGEHAIAAVDLALNWSSADRPNKGFVLEPLLKRRDLTNGADRAAVKHAVDWTETAFDRRDIGFVLKPLLERVNLYQLADVVLARAFHWLAHYGQTIEAGYVLAPLLAREDLRERRAEAHRYGAEWLSSHVGRSDASFVLVPLLRSKALLGWGAEVQRVTNHWLESYGRTINAGYVLSALLDLDGEPVSQAGFETGVEWVQRWPEAPAVPYVLAGLLEQSALTQEGARQVRARAIEWLERHGGMRSAGILLDRLLRFVGCYRLDRSQVEGHVRTWLGQWGGSPQAGYVFAGWLLGGWHKATLDEDEVLSQARAWSRDSGKGTAKIVRLCDPESHGDPSAVDEAIAWVSNKHQSPFLPDILAALLLEHGDDPAVVSQVRATLARMEDEVDPRLASLALKYALAESDVKGPSES